MEIPVLEPDPDAPGESKEERERAGLSNAGQGGGEMGGEGAGQSGRTRRLVGLGVGGAGIAALAAGLGFGWSAKATWNDAFDSGLCDRDALTCTPAGQDKTDPARSRALASNILIGAGVAMAAAGVVLYLTAPSSVEKAGIAVVPVAGPGEIGMAVQGGF